MSGVRSNGARPRRSGSWALVLLCSLLGGCCTLFGDCEPEPPTLEERVTGLMPVVPPTGGEKAGAESGVAGGGVAPDAASDVQAGEKTPEKPKDPPVKFATTQDTGKLEKSLDDLSNRIAELRKALPDPKAEKGAPKRVASASQVAELAATLLALKERIDKAIPEPPKPKEGGDPPEDPKKIVPDPLLTKAAAQLLVRDALQTRLTGKSAEMDSAAPSKPVDGGELTPDQRIATQAEVTAIGEQLDRVEEVLGTALEPGAVPPTDASDLHARLSTLHEQLVSPVGGQTVDPRSVRGLLERIASFFPNSGGEASNGPQPQVWTYTDATLDRLEDSVLNNLMVLPLLALILLVLVLGMRWLTSVKDEVRNSTKHIKDIMGQMGLEYQE